MNTSTTPFFPPWRCWQRPAAAPTRPSTAWWHRATLTELERECADALPANLLTRPAAGTNSRQRIYTRPRTFWCFLWQVLQPQASCREVVRQVQALGQIQGRGTMDEGTSAYCQARQRLPLSVLESALTGSARRVELQHRAVLSCLQGREVKVVDGTTLTLPDTPANQRHYPQMANQQTGCGFPLLKLVVLFSLRSARLPDGVGSGGHLAGGPPLGELCGRALGGRARRGPHRSCAHRIAAREFSSGATLGTLGSLGPVAQTVHAGRRLYGGAMGEGSRDATSTPHSNADSTGGVSHAPDHLGDNVASA